MFGLMYRAADRSAFFSGKLRSCCVAALCACLLGFPLEQASAARVTPAPEPYAVLPVDKLGFRPLGQLYLLLRLSSLSLNFIDDSHVLFTFHRSGLMTRENDPWADDQMIRAMVLEVPSGKVTASTEWRMHDRQQYLLPTGHGEFLVRERGDIYRVGQDLELHPFLRINQRIERISISPDGEMLTVQSDLERHSEEAHESLLKQALKNGTQYPDEDVQIRMIELKEKKVVADAKADAPLQLTGTPEGYVGHQELSPGKWRLSLHKMDGSTTQLGVVASTCEPSHDFINEDTILLQFCEFMSADHYAAAIDLTGKQKWTGTWDAHFVFPSLEFSSQGKDFAIAWLRVSHAVDQFNPMSESDVQGQVVQVLSTRTGHLLLSVNASPINSAGQNFALSADGSRLAVLDQGAIRLYKVPEEEVSERAGKEKSPRP